MIPIKITCQICGFDISKFGKKYTSSRTCKMCEKRSVNKFEDQLTESYEEQLSKFCPTGVLPTRDKASASSTSITKSTKSTKSTTSTKTRISKPKFATHTESQIKINLGFSMDINQILEDD